MEKLKLIYLSAIIYLIVDPTFIKCRGEMITGCNRQYSTTRHTNLKNINDTISPHVMIEVGQRGEKGSHVCGGTLISKRVVVTAASCFRLLNGKLVDQDQVWVCAESEQHNLLDLGFGNKYILHEEYQETSDIPKNDIAVIIIDWISDMYSNEYNFEPAEMPVASSIALSECTIAYLCYNGGGDSVCPSENFAEEIIGGSNFHRDRITDGTTEMVAVTVLPYEKCFGLTRDSKFCGKANARRCLDYSGAGLICNNKLIGVLTKLCVADQINEYTNVFAHEAWIADRAVNLAASISSIFAISTLFGVFFGQSLCIQLLLDI